MRSAENLLVIASLDECDWWYVHFPALVAFSQLYHQQRY